MNDSSQENERLDAPGFEVREVLRTLERAGFGEQVAGVG